MRRFLVVLTLLSVGCPKAVPPSLQPDELITYRTEDGWEADIRHFKGDGPPVLIVHGMGANHYNFDYHEDVSLSHYLQQSGWDVWIPELRGDPGARPPYKKARGEFTFDDLAHDLPFAVESVLEATGQEQLDWVGHSMGGMLLYTALSNYPDKIRSGVAICSPSTFDHPLPIHKSLAKTGWAVRGRGRLPARALAKMTAPLGRANVLFARIANTKNLDWGLAKGLARHALIDLPRPMAAQAVQWMREGEFVSTEGVPWIVPGNDTPLLVFGAIDDKVAPEPDVASTCQFFGDCTYVRLAKDNGFAVDYGHVDPVVGKSAPTDVYPHIKQFLWAQEALESKASVLQQPAFVPEPAL